jgi:hypothetical protein
MKILKQMPKLLDLYPQNVYYFSPNNTKYIKLDGADPQTFHVFEEFGPLYEFSRDKNHIYKKGNILPAIDAETFEFLNAFI